MNRFTSTWRVKAHHWFLIQLVTLSRFLIAMACCWIGWELIGKRVPFVMGIASYAVYMACDRDAQEIVKGWGSS